MSRLSTVKMIDKAATLFSEAMAELEELEAVNQVLKKKCEDLETEVSELEDENARLRYEAL